MYTGQLNETEAIEACVEALDEATAMLSHHPPRALAAALAVHLQGLLTVLHAQRELSRQEIRQWLDELGRGACLESA